MFYFSEHRAALLQNSCVICEKSIWSMISSQKPALSCTICKALIHKKCLDPTHPNFPKCNVSSPENQLFGVHLERICKEGTWYLFFALIFIRMGLYWAFDITWQVNGYLNSLPRSLDIWNFMEQWKRVSIVYPGPNWKWTDSRLNWMLIHSVLTSILAILMLTQSPQPSKTSLENFLNLSYPTM